MWRSLIISPSTRPAGHLRSFVSCCKLKLSTSWQGLLEPRSGWCIVSALPPPCGQFVKTFAFSGALQKYFISESIKIFLFHLNPNASCTGCVLMYFDPISRAFRPFYLYHGLLSHIANSEYFHYPQILKYLLLTPNGQKIALSVQPWIWSLLVVSKF